MDSTQQQKRPKYLNLIAIRLPLPGLVSILHRISGILMIYAWPFGIWALDVATEDAGGYAKVTDVLSHPLSKLVILLVIWSAMHHLCAGIRFLLIEIRIGLELPTARLSSIIVMVVSLLLTAALGMALLR